jgi:hypothetical protein
MDLWAHSNQVPMDFNRRGKPTENAIVESFNGTRSAPAPSSGSRAVDEQIRMVSLGLTEDADHARQRGINPSAHVHRFHCEPGRVDPNHLPEDERRSLTTSSASRQSCIDAAAHCADPPYPSSPRLRKRPSMPKRARSNRPSNYDGASSTDS